MRTWWLVASASLLAACVSGLDQPSQGTEPSGSDGSGTAGVTSEPTDFDKAMLQIASTYAKDFSRVNSAPYQSALGAFDINLFVHGDSRIYRAIHPEDTTSTSNVDISVGTVIVREVLDSSGGITKLTMMAKGPAGYDPTLGDWWFAVTDPTGAPLSGDTGLQVGRLAECHSCHVPRASSDFLFGVPRADEPSH
jgi:hypothetical protein